MCNKSFANLAGADRAFLIGLIIWVALQLSRAIALTLIDSIDAGADSNAWLYPAYLDLFATFFAIPLMWAIWKHRGLFTWTATIIYLAVSIVDHGGNLVTTTFVGAPSIAEGMNPYLIPVIQTALDILFMVLLFVARFRSLFFRIEESAE